MRKCSKKSKKTRTTNKYNKVKEFHSRPLDQIKTQVISPKEKEEIKLEKISEGQWECEKCDKFFRDQHTLDVHMKTKGHKRRIKEWEKEQHTQKAAEAAVGLQQ